MWVVTVALEEGQRDRTLHTEDQGNKRDASDYMLVCYNCGDVVGGAMNWGNLYGDNLVT